MPQFILLPFDPPGPFEELGPEEMQRIIQRYTSWTAKLRKQGRLKAADKLRHGEGKVLRGAGKKMTVTDGPYVETKEVVGGFWIIEAADYDEAVRLAADCPHLDYGTLSIRAIDR
jgi:hypothetical protein